MTSHSPIRQALRDQRMTPEEFLAEHDDGGQLKAESSDIIATYWKLAKKVLASVTIGNHIRHKNSQFTRLTNGDLVRDIKLIQEKEEEFQINAESVLNSSICT